MADTLKQVQLDRQRLIENNKGASESSRAALSAISGRNVLKTKNEVEKLRRNEEIARQQNAAVAGIAGASNAITMEKARLADARHEESLGLSRERLALSRSNFDLRRQRLEEQKKRDQKNDVLSMLNMGIFDPSFASTLEMPEDIVRQAAANKKAQIDATKARKAAAAKAQADYENALKMRDDTKPAEKTAAQKNVDKAIEDAEKKGIVSGTAAEAKEGILSAANVSKVVIPWATSTEALLMGQTKSVLDMKNATMPGSEQQKKIKQAAEQRKVETSESERRTKEASVYYDEAMTRRVYEKEKAGDELSPLENLFKSENENSAAYTLRSKRFAAEDKMAAAVTPEEVNTAYNEYLSALDEKRVEVVNTAIELQDRYFEKQEAVETFTAEELEQIEETKAQLEEVRSLMEKEIEGGFLTEEGKKLLQTEMENINTAIEVLESASYYDEHFEENRDALVYQQMEAKYADKNAPELEAYVEQLKKELLQVYGTVDPEGRPLSTARGIDPVAYRNRQQLKKDPRYKEYTELNAYLEQRAEKEKKAEVEEAINETLENTPGESPTDKVNFHLESIKDGLRTEEEFAGVPMDFYSWDDERQLSWLKENFGDGHDYSGFEEWNDGDKQKFIQRYVYEKEEALTNVGRELDKAGKEFEKDLINHYTANVTADYEVLLPEEKLQGYVDAAVEHYGAAEKELFMTAGNDSKMLSSYILDMWKYNKGRDGVFEGDYSDIVTDIEGFLNGEYGHFTPEEGKRVLALMERYGTDAAFDYYAATKEAALRREAEGFGKVERTIRGVTSGLTNFLTNGGEMLENAFTQQYSRIAGTLGTASHQINMENFSRNTGIGSEAAEMLYMAGYSIFEMVPAVALGAVPYVGGALSSAYTFAKVTATTYNDSILQGKRADEALTYSILTATAEVGLEKALGTGGQTFAKTGAGKMWKEAVENLSATKAMKVIVKTAGSMGSEGFEEFLQECLSPFLEKVAADLNGIDDATLKEIDWDEAAKSFAIGALTGFVFGGIDSISSTKSGGMKESEAQALLESGAVVNIINAAAELGNKRALTIKQAIQNSQVLYEGQQGYFAYASPADVMNMVQSTKRRSYRRSLQLLEARYAEQQTDEGKRSRFKTLFKKILQGNTLTLQETAEIINDEEMSIILSEMLGMDVVTMLPDRVRAISKLLAFAPDGKISKERLSLFKDAFGEIDAKAIEDILTYSDMGAKKGAGIIYEDADAETQLTEAEQESAEVLKILSTEVGTVFYVTEQFETGTYLAANVMAVRRGDLAGGVAQTILHRVYYITKRLNPEAGKTIKALVLEELKNKYTAEAFSTAVVQIRKEMAANGNDISVDTAEDELCAREFPTIMLEGAITDKLAATDMAAVQLIRKSLYAVQSHLSEEVTLSAVKGKVTFDGVDQSKLNERQRATVKAISVGFGAMGINVEFFESPVNQLGEHMGINGSYDPATNTVRLDIAAGIKGEDAILFTASHELTHFIKEWSEDKYQAFADFLLEKYAERGVDVEALVQAKIEASKKSSAYKEALSYEAAMEEVICDSCETFLRDSNLMESLTELAKKDQTLFERVKEFFANLLEDLRRVYRGLLPDSAEANIVLEMTGCLEDLHAMWEDAALSARGNFERDEKVPARRNTAKESNDLIEGFERWGADETAQKNTTEGGVKMQLKGYTKDGRRVYESGFPNSISQDERVTIFKKRIATIFNLGAVELKTDVKKITIKGDMFTLQKNLFGDDIATRTEMEAKVNAMYDMADILATAKYLPKRTKKEDSYVNPNVTPKNAAHKGVKYWYKFQNEIVFDGVPYTVIFNIRDKGKDQYQYLIEFKENKTPGLSNTVFKKHKDLLRTDRVSTKSIRQTDQKSQDISENIFLESPTGKTNDLYNRLTALVRGEEVSMVEGARREADFDIDSYADQEFTYSDAEQVRAENNGADIARNFEDLTPEEREAEYADLQNEIDAYITDVVLQEQIEAEEATRRGGNVDVTERVGAKREKEKDPFWKLVKDSRNWIRRKMVDSGQAVYDIGKKIKDDYLYGYYNMARASQQAGVTMVSKWQTDVTGKVVGKSLQEIWAPIVVQGKAYAKKFDAYLLHLHNIDRMSRYDPEALAEARHQYEVEKAYLSEELQKMTDDEIRAIAHDRDSAFVGEARDYINALDNYNHIRNIKDKPVFGYDVSAEDSRAAVQNFEWLYPEFKEYREAVYQYVDNLLQYRVDSGLISVETKALLKKTYPHYVPTVRVQAEEAPPKKHWWQKEKNRKQTNKVIGKARGGNQEIISLYDQIAGQTMSVVREGSRNRLGVRLLQQRKSIEEIKNAVLYSDKLTDPLLIDRHLDEIDPFMTLENKNIFAVFEDGKFWEMEVTDDLWEAVQALDKDEEPQNGFKKFAKWNVDTFKRLITSLNPVFAIRNPIKDIADGLFYSKDAKRWLAAMPAAIKEMKKGGELWQQYVALGGGFSTYFDFARMSTKEPRGIGKFTGRIEALNQAIEQFPRFAEFIATVRKGDGSMDNLMEAMHNAADITTNFGRSGSTGRMLNRYWIPFFNPSIQGMSKAVRAWTEQRSVKGFVALGAKAVVFGIAPAVINALLYRDDEEWDMIKQTDKDRYFLFKIKDGLWARIPKGRMLSVFGGIGDRTLQAIDGEEFEWASLIQTTVDQMAPSNPIESNIVGPLFLASINRTWYGTEIVGERLKNEPDAEQYDTKTDEISKWIGSVTGLSPKKVNYVLDAYGGIVGDVLLPAFTPAAERSVFAQAFTLDTNYSNRMSGDFYDKLDELSDRKNSVKATVEDDILYRWWNRNADTISEINAEIRKIEEDASLTSHQKKEKVNEQYVIRNAAMLGFEENYDRYAEAVTKYSENTADMSNDDAKEYIYREANREIFGTEYALKAYGKSTYERAVKVRDEQGIDFDTFYDVYFDAEEPDVEKCFSLIEDGFEKEPALEIARNIGALEPLDGAKSVSAIQKYSAIDAADITEDEKLWAMTVLASETDRLRVTILADYNVTLKQFIAVKDNVAYLDDQNEGGVTNAMVKAAVDDVEGLNGSQRAALWQLFTGSSSAKNNPYSVEIGSKALAKNKALKEENSEK